MGDTASPTGDAVDDAVAAGVELAMVGLRRHKFVLALFSGQPEPGQVFAIGLVMEADEISALGGRLSAEVIVGEPSPTWLAFIDRHGIHWQVSTSDQFRTQGEMHGHWLEV